MVIVASPASRVSQRLLRGSWLAPGIFVGALLFFCLTDSGHVQTIDVAEELAVSRALLHGHTWITGFAALPGGGVIQGVGHRFYAAHDIGYSLIALPLSALLRLHTIGQGAWNFLTTLIDPFFGAATLMVFAAFCRQLVASRSAVLVATAVAGLTTPIWVYAHTSFDAMPTAFFVLLSAYALWRFRDRPRMGWIALSSASAGIAVLIREDSALYVAVAGLWVLYLAVQRSNVRRFRYLAAAAVPLAVAAAVTLWYDAARFGSITDSGHANDPQTGATTPILHGAAALLASPGKGLLFFAPTILLALWGLRQLRVIAPDLTVVVIASLLAYVAFMGRLNNWSGAEAWGPRFLIPILPLSLLPMVTVFAKWRALALPCRALLALIVTVGFFVQVPGVLTEGVAVDRLHGGVEQQLAWHWNSQIYFAWEALGRSVDGKEPYPSTTDGGVIAPPVPKFDQWWAGGFPAVREHPTLRDGALGVIVLALVAVGIGTGLRERRAPVHATSAPVTEVTD